MDLFKPENITIFLILQAMSHIFDTDIKKVPKSLEEHCRETMKIIQTEEMSRRRGYERTQLNRKKRSILREIAEQECKKMIAYETAVDIEEIKNIVQTAYNSIIEYNEDKEKEEAEELRTINGSTEETNFGPKQIIIECTCTQEIPS